MLSVYKSSSNGQIWPGKETKYYKI